MERAEYEILRSKFLKVIARVPENIRNNDIVAVVEGSPYTWNTALIEVKNGTKKGDRILKILKEMEII